MKKYLPYILIALVVIAAILLFLAGKNKNRVLDERFSLRRRDKIPYGSFVAYESLGQMYPKALIFNGRQEPGNWDLVSVYDKNQAVFIICPEFSADKNEMKSLIGFAENGNDVFISAIDLSYDATAIFHCDINTTQNPVSYFSRLAESDTLTVSLTQPLFPGSASYTYPGKKYDGYFSNLDSLITTVLGYDQSGRPDFIHLRAGKGNIYVHLAPMAFTNYFLLHKNNFDYYEKVLSLISPATTKVLWDEYYLYKNKNNNETKKKNWLAVLLGTENAAGEKPFAAAFWLLLLLLLLYVVLEMRRKQRYIPVIKKPRNDSLEFVKTIGRLYHDKGDHLNLCRKMSAYFLEHVRNRYKLPTSELNEEFISHLHIKTGIDIEELRNIVGFIRDLENAYAVSDKDLILFHKQMESFYKKE